MIGGTCDKSDVFAFDEDMIPRELRDSKFHYYTREIESDESLEGTKKTKSKPNTPSKSSQNPETSQSPRLSVPASLPIDIARAYSPFENLASEPETETEDDDDDDDDEAEKKPKKPKKRMKDEDMYRNMQAYSRSIQPADDPERLFGERPHRRYRPIMTTQSNFYRYTSSSTATVPKSRIRVLTEPMIAPEIIYTEEEKLALQMKNVVNDDDDDDESIKKTLPKI